MAQSPIGHEVITSNSATPLATLGEVIEVCGSQGLKRYQYVQFDNGTGNVASVAGGLAYYLNTTNWTGYTVTMDVSDTTRNMVAGVFTAVLTDLYYGWIQVRGYNSAIVTNGDDDIAAGDAIITSASGDGTADSTASGTAPVARVVAWAVSADVDAANTVEGNIVLN